jgi:type I restriction enzyme S subunit
MSENARKPSIRFAGFDDAWEQRKLGDIGTTFTGLSGKSKEDFGHGDARFVTYMNVFTNPISSQDMTENVEIDSRQNEVKYGDIFFTTSSETPEEVGMSSIWLFKMPNVYLNSFCFGYRPNEKFDPYYLAFMLRSPVIRKNFSFLAQGISRYNISKNKVMEMTVSIPKNDEQQQIGAFFQNLDNIIALHQRKLEKLKNIKKSMLEKMFV